MRSGLTRGASFARSVKSAMAPLLTQAMQHESAREARIERHEAIDAASIRKTGEIMRRFRRCRRLTLAAMARLLGISTSLLCEMERGTKPYRIKYIARAQLIEVRNGHPHK